MILASTSDKTHEKLTHFISANLADGKLAKLKEVSLEKEGITYIGINNPVVVIDSKVEIDREEKNISLSGVRYDSKYKEVQEK